MPLESGKSKAAFEHNLKAELKAGKPKDQALAISYAQQRKDSFVNTNEFAKLDEVVARCDAYDKKDCE